MTTSQQAASALVDALADDLRTAGAVEALVLTRLMARAAEVRATVDALAAARRAEDAERKVRLERLEEVSRP